jgi:hypothetical protein
MNIVIQKWQSNWLHNADRNGSHDIVRNFEDGLKRLSDDGGQCRRFAKRNRHQLAFHIGFDEIVLN